MLPDLIEATPTLSVGFDFSLPHDLFATLSLIVKAPWRSGFSEWVYETAAALGPQGRRDVATLTPLLGMVVRGQQPPILAVADDAAAWRDLEAYLAYLDDQPSAFYADLAARFVCDVAECVAPGDTGMPLAGLLARYVDDQRARRGGAPVYFDSELAEALLMRPALLHERLTHFLGAFATHHYGPSLAREADLLRGALAYHRRQLYRGQIDDIFGAVTGRTLPHESHLTLAQAAEVIFVPSPHIGPYFYVVTSGPRAYVSFNARTVAAGRSAEPSTPEVVHLFPPLKALADETRLHILALLQPGEHTQDSLVAALGISQPTASRHLGLLERVSLVRVRRDNGVKYYSVDRIAGRDFVTFLRAFLA